MASNSRHNKVVQHGDEIHVLLQVSLNILKHTLSNMETFHVDHNLSENLSLSFFFVEWSLLLFSRSFRSMAATGIIADLRLRRHETILGHDGVVYFRNGL